MPPYLNAPDANALLLSRFGLAASVTTGDLDLASDALDGMAPFKGTKTDPAQERQFPRDGKATPEAVLDYVALRASYSSQAESMTATSSRGAGGVSRSYARPKITRLEAYLKSASRAVERHQRRNGRLV